MSDGQIVHTMFAVLLTCYWSVHFLAFMTCNVVHPNHQEDATYAKVSNLLSCTAVHPNHHEDATYAKEARAKFLNKTAEQIIILKKRFLKHTGTGPGTVPVFFCIYR